MTLMCPRTNSPLKEVLVDGIKVDISEKCGGLWLDNFEIKKIDEAKESAGDKLVEILEKFIDKKVDLDTRIKCPKCKDAIMMRNFYSPKRCFQVDTCPSCAGVWLDPGELTHLRSLFKTEAEKNAHAQAFVDEITDKAFAPMLKESKENLEKAKSIAKALRFICPSSYIKGKQSWGAF
jgi:Zn-finger nucleic acid-binding protein